MRSTDAGTHLQQFDGHVLHWTYDESPGLCDELITRSEESYRLWCVVVSDLETS